MRFSSNAEVAARLYAARRARDDVFGADRDGFAEPAWDMLLALMAHDEQAEPIGEDEILELSAAPVEIAETFLAWLVTRKMVQIRTNADSPHLRVVELVDRGRQLLEAYLSRLSASEPQRP